MIDVWREGYEGEWGERREMSLKWEKKRKQEKKKKRGKRREEKKRVSWLVGWLAVCNHTRTKVIIIMGQATS